MFLLVFALLCIGMFAQQRKFDIVLLGNVIGYTSISKKAEGDAVSYALQSKSRAKILFQERTQDLEFEAKYIGGLMSHSFCKIFNNGVLNTTEVSRKGDNYIIRRDTVAEVVKEPINFSSMELYFSEPVNVPKVFSERMGEFAAFTKTAPGEYMNKIKDVTNIYRYRNGLLYEVEIRKALGSVFLRAKN